MGAVQELHPNVPEYPANELPDFRESALLGQVTILGERDGRYEALVPIKLTSYEGIVVDEPHVLEIKDLLKKEAEEKGGTGQITPIWVAYLPGRNDLPITDGSHRCEALSRMGIDEVVAIIRPVKDWEDVVAQRIRATKTHAVQFPRIIDWVTDAWNRTEWAQKKGISAKTAFSISFNARMSGTELGLQPEEMAAIRTWAIDSSKAWDTKPGNIYKYLLWAETASPELVRATRNRQKGQSDSRLTPHHLHVIASTFPHEPNYEFQSFVAKIVTDNGLSVAQTRAVTQALQQARISNNPAAEITRITTGKMLQAIIDNPVYTADQQRQMNRKKSTPNEAANSELLDRLFAASLRGAALLIENGILRSQTSPHTVSSQTPRSRFERIARGVRPEALPYMAAVMRIQDPHAMAERPALQGERPEPLPPAFVAGVRDILPRLSYIEEQTLILAAFFNMSREATAQILNVSRDTVGFLLERAQNQLPKTVKRLQLPGQS